VFVYITGVPGSGKSSVCAELQAREDQIEGVRIPRHEPGPPETLSVGTWARGPGLLP
jgi:hypothetical protein